MTSPAPDTGRTAEEMRGAPPAIPVRARYYLTKCPGCGWVGSSEQCGVDHGCDDSDVYCPVCGEAGCEDDPREADARAHGEAVMQRIVTANAEIAQLRSRLLQAEKGGEIDIDQAMKRGIRAWSARLHIPVTRMMSRVLREEIRAALNPNQEDGDATV